MKKTVGIAALAIACTGLLGACGGNAGATTCSDYAAQDSSKRSSTLKSLLKENDLDPNSSVNVVGVTAAVHAHCGVLFGSTANRNSSSQIQNAVNWTSPTW